MLYKEQRERKKAHSFFGLFLSYSYYCTVFKSDRCLRFETSFLTICRLLVNLSGLSELQPSQECSLHAVLCATQPVVVVRVLHVFIMSINNMTDRVVDIVGIGIGDRGRSCEEHTVCGSVLQPDVLVRLLKEEVMVEGRIETAICVYWVTDSVERCRVGFLPRFMI